MVANNAGESESGSRNTIHRVVRSLSGTNGSTTPDVTVTSHQRAAAVAEHVDRGQPEGPEGLGTPLHRDMSETSSQNKWIGVGDRLKKLGKDIGKLAKNVLGGKSTASQASVDDSSAAGSLISGPSSPRSPGRKATHNRLLSLVAEGEEPDDNQPQASGSGSGAHSASTEVPEPDTLARRIQDLIDNLPPPTPGSGYTTPILNARDETGRPIPPPNPSPIKDSRLVSFLSNATIMNGSALKGRQSIWSILESTGAPPHSIPPPEYRPTEDEGEGNRDEGNRDDQDIFSDNSSVMVYSPLLPGEADLVELAESVPVAVDEVNFRPEVASGTAWTTFWPLSILYGEEQKAQQATAPTPDLSGDVVVSPGRDASGKRVQVRTVRAWVPSKDKLSVQAMWWGYRLYLPPPVLDILSDEALEAAKRTSMITAALTWFFNNLPIDALPIAVRPALLLLQRLAPFLGYIGTFISWSWATIRTFDIGYGVTLTATWLLPIALIPGTWHENDFPKSPEPIPHTPLPLIDTTPPTSLFTPDTLQSPQSLFTSSPATPTNAISDTLGSPSSPSLNPNSPPTLSPPLTVDLPVPADPEGMEPPPVPPEVSVGSPLSFKLLRGPVLRPVPLPPENEGVDSKGKKREKNKGIFRRKGKDKDKD